MTREDYIISLYQKINPEIKVTSKTKIKNTSIEILCKYEAPYKRIKDWCERKVLELENKKDLIEFKEIMNDCYKLMISRNKKYGDSYKKLRLDSIIDLMAMKLDRCQKQKLDSKAIKAELEDIVNYGVFGLKELKDKNDK